MVGVRGRVESLHRLDAADAADRAALHEHISIVDDVSIAAAGYVDAKVRDVPVRVGAGARWIREQLDLGVDAAWGRDDEVQVCLWAGEEARDTSAPARDLVRAGAKLGLDLIEALERR